MLCVRCLSIILIARLADRIALCFQTPNMAEMPTCGMNGRGRREPELKAPSIVWIQKRKTNCSSFSQAGVQGRRAALTSAGVTASR